MSNPIESIYKLYSNNPPPLPTYAYNAQKRVEHSYSRLKNHLDKRQKSLLLGIIDDKDLVCSITAEQQFADGFKAAVKLMCAVFYKEIDF